MEDTQKKWTDNERKIVIDYSKTRMPKEIIGILQVLGYKRRTTKAIEGIIRRHKEKLSGNTPKTTPTECKLVQPKIMIFDIEATDLSAEFGEMICFGYQWYHEAEPTILKMWDYKGWNKLPVEQRDLYLLQDVVKLIEEADVLVGHFSPGFDFPFIQTRCLMHGMKPIPKPVHIDTWRIAKKNLRLNNNKLKTIARAFKCDEQKSEVPLYIWRRAKAHDVEAMEIIAEYNAQDVRTQKSITEKLMPLSNNMPNWNLLIGEDIKCCPACGSSSLRYKGWSYTKLYKYKRLRCNECGKWMRDRNSVTPKETKRVVS